MFFIYVDESGAAGFDPMQHFFVLAAIALEVERCLLFQQKLKKIKQAFCLGDEVEIKGRDIEQEKKIFKHISLETRRDLVKRLFSLLFENNIFLFSVVFSKEEESIQRLKMSPDDIYHYSYKRLIDILENFLDSKDDNGMLLVDSRASSIHSHLRDDRLIRFHKECLDQLVREGKQTRIIEYPVFVQSEFFAAVQLADLCAYHIFHALQIKFGQPFLKAIELKRTKFVLPIDHHLFQSAEFLDSLFSQPEINLPILAKIIKQRGRIEKTP